MRETLRVDGIIWALYSQRCGARRALPTAYSISTPESFTVAGAGARLFSLRA
jgi:hypothetical protein